MEEKMSELDDAIAAVSAEAEKEVTGGAAEVTPEPTPEAAPAAEPPEEKSESGRERDENGRFVPRKDAPAEEEEEEEPLGLSAEELAAINADEKLQRIYKSMQRGLTKKTMSLSEKSKLLEQRAMVADWIQSDPDAALRAIAAARGKKLLEEGEPRSEAAKEVVDALEAEWEKAFDGKEAPKILRPLFEKTAESVLRKVFANEIEPLKMQVAHHNEEAAKRGILAAKEEFVAKVKGSGNDWNEAIEKEMAAMVRRIEPGKREDGSDVSIDEYLQDIYDAVMYRRGRSAAKREELKRLRAVRDTAEPVSTIRPAKTTQSSITTDMSDKDAIALAVAQAQREMGS